MIEEEDLILKRSDQGLCPICKVKIGTDFQVVEYKNQKIWICKKHPVLVLNKKKMKK